MRRLYDWTLHWANTPYALPALFLLSFAEASVFPIPPDVLLLAMGLANPSRSLVYAAVSTLGSVLGATLGWFLGAGLWAALGISPACPEYAGGAWFFDNVPSFSCEVFGRVAALYHQNALAALLTAAFTPIPFKVFTLAAGVFGVPITTLVLASGVGRSGRFFGVSFLIRIFGHRIRPFIEERFNTLTLVFAALLIGGFIIVKYV